MHSNAEGMGGARDGNVESERGSPAARRSTGLESVSALPDADLLAATRRLMCQSNRVLAALLAHLAEVEARGLHRTRACSSLYTYCIYELRMPEDTAYRRVAAARLVQRFPLLTGAVERGELHLTGLLLLAPHLTETNVAGVLERAKFRTKKEITKLVRLLSPLPDVPSRIEPLGLARPAHPFSRPTWSTFVASLCPVRELQPHERPSGWLPASEGIGGEAPGLGADVTSNETAGPPARYRQAGEPTPAQKAFVSISLEETASQALDSDAIFGTAPARLDSLVAVPAFDDSVHAHRSDNAIEPAPARHGAVTSARPIEHSTVYAVSFDATVEPALARHDDVVASVLTEQSAPPIVRTQSSTSAVDAPGGPALVESAPAPARHDDTALRLSGPQRYKVQFTASEEYVALVEEAKALLAHALPRADLAEIHLRALRGFVAALKKRKYAKAMPLSAAASNAAAASLHDEEPSARSAAPVPDVEQLPNLRSMSSSPLNDSIAVLGAEPAIGAASVSPCALLGEHAIRDAEQSSSRSAPRSDELSRSGQVSEPPRRRGRHVPANVRRAVFERDGHRCAFVDARGVRCRETSRLEFHHHEPFARGGPSTPENLLLYCASHNALAAERDFEVTASNAKHEHPHITERTLTCEAPPE